MLNMVKLVPLMLAVLIAGATSAVPASAWVQDGCLWPHTPGQFTYIDYAWGTEIDWDPKTDWRSVYTSAQSDWNGAQGRLRVNYNAFSASLVTTYDALDGQGAFTNWQCSGSSRYLFYTGGNRAYGPWSAGYLNFVGDQEWGHVFALGHSTVNPAVMQAPWNGTSTYPQADDINGIDTLYP